MVYYDIMFGFLFYSLEMSIKRLEDSFDRLEKKLDDRFDRLEKLIIGKDIG